MIFGDADMRFGGLVEVVLDSVALLQQKLPGNGMLDVRARGGGQWRISG